MAKEIRNSVDAIIEGILTRAGKVTSIIQIENRLLDGSYSVQMIGGEAVEVNVEFYCERTSLEELQECSTTGTPITIIYDDQTFSGIIRGGTLLYEFILPCKYKTTFTLIMTT